MPHLVALGTCGALIKVKSAANHLPYTKQVALGILGQCNVEVAQELCESRGGRPGLPVPNSPYGLCGRKTILNLNLKLAK